MYYNSTYLSIFYFCRGSWSFISMQLPFSFDASGFIKATETFGTQNSLVNSVKLMSCVARKQHISLNLQFYVGLKVCKMGQSTTSRTSFKGSTEARSFCAWKARVYPELTRATFAKRAPLMNLSITVWQPPGLSTFAPRSSTTTGIQLSRPFEPPAGWR